MHIISKHPYKIEDLLLILYPYAVLFNNFDKGINIKKEEEKVFLETFHTIRMRE